MEKYRDSKGRFKKGIKPHNSGKKWSKKVRDKISNSHMGKTPWNKGKKQLKTTGDLSPSKRPEVREKIRQSKLGKKRSKKTRKKISESRIGKYLGDKNPNWKGGKSFESYTKEFNNQFKRLIRKRDNQICMVCETHREKLKRALSIHHINYDKKLTIPENCISLCQKCHLITNGNRNHWKLFLQNLLKEKYNYQYSENNEVILDISEALNGS